MSRLVCASFTHFGRTTIRRTHKCEHGKHGHKKKVLPHSQVCHFVELTKEDPVVFFMLLLLSLISEYEKAVLCQTAFKKIDSNAFRLRNRSSGQSSSCRSMSDWYILETGVALSPGFCKGSWGSMEVVMCEAFYYQAWQHFILLVCTNLYVFNQ